MLDPAWMQAKWIVDQLFSLLKIVIWPAFLWFFTKRSDVQEHIRQLLSREWRVKIPGADVRVTSVERPKPLPAEESETELLDPPKPRRHTT